MTSTVTSHADLQAADGELRLEVTADDDADREHRSCRRIRVKRRARNCAEGLLDVLPGAQA